jgi:hypothetical protein
MNIPFTAEAFLDVFRQYNEAVFPMQTIFFLAAILSFYFAIRPGILSDRWISGFLAFLWLWMGIVYHLIFFTAINKAAFLFGAVFILQGILFLRIGVFQNKLSFRFRTDRYGWTSMALIFFALIVYPTLGYWFGHTYPSSPTFGLPCPTTIFTFGMLLLCSKRCPIYIVIIPFLWAVIGFMAAFNFGIKEDTGLMIAAIITLPMMLMHNKTYTE